MERGADAVGVDVDEAGNEAPTITAHEVVPGRTLFAESDNTDGWIATDVTVDADP